MYTRAVSGQRLGKHVTTATNRGATIDINWKHWFYYVRAKELLGGNLGEQVSSVWESVKRGLELVKLRNLHYYKPLPVTGRLGKA
jgi:hypothetical protein